MIALSMMLSNNLLAHGNNHLGQINFPTTGKPAAQLYFEKGVMYLHSFQYEEARANFQLAEKIDPAFALAYWGDAMTYNHPLWAEQDYNSAIKTLKRFAATAEARVKKTKSPKEKNSCTLLTYFMAKETKRHVIAAIPMPCANCIVSILRMMKLQFCIPCHY
jgi:tetratricopeptide (TPR) repeat protein